MPKSKRGGGQVGLRLTPCAQPPQSARSKTNALTRLHCLVPGYPVHRPVVNRSIEAFEEWLWPNGLAFDFRSRFGGSRGAARRFDGAFAAARRCGGARTARR